MRALLSVMHGCQQKLRGVDPSGHQFPFFQQGKIFAVAAAVGGQGPNLGFFVLSLIGNTADLFVYLLVDGPDGFQIFA